MTEGGKRGVLLDTGPLVAVLAGDEEAHDACLEAMDGLTSTPYTCWPVVAEAAWLLRKNRRAHDGMLEWIESGAVELLDLAPADIAGIRTVLKRFDSLNPQFADACLVHLAEREEIDTIFTLDRRDFSVYRTTGGKAFRLLPEAL